jgi:hypothetical protein
LTLTETPERQAPSTAPPDRQCGEDCENESPLDQGKLSAKLNDLGDLRIQILNDDSLIASEVMKLAGSHLL